MMDNLTFSSILEDHTDSLPKKIANHILMKIFKGELQQGDRLIEADITKELNVSNIPVRESFYILQNTGVIERLPRKGVRVKPITEKEFKDYTNALIDILKVAIDASADKWDDEKLAELQRLARDAHQTLLENNILAYIVNIHRLCGYLFVVADNLAYTKFYDDITFITNAYSRMTWVNSEKTAQRFAYVEAIVEAIIGENYEEAKKAIELLTKTSLSVDV